MCKRALFVASMVLGISTSLQAQMKPPAHMWSHCTTLTMSGGVSTASDYNGAMLSGAIGWEMTPRLGLEGSGMWFDKQTGSSGWAGGLNLRAVLAESQTIAPFVEGGFGLYAASFDPKLATRVPPFYRDRMSGVITNWFTDPAFFAAAGFDLWRNNRIAVRPTIGAIIAVNDGQAYTTGTATVRVEYHFGGLPPDASRSR
jgi:hypothetical protein